MKTLIIYGSPRESGDSAALAGILRKNLSGEIVALSAYRAKISACVDCRYCKTHSKCAIADDMALIYNDDFDNVVIASPVHTSTLPGPLVSLSSRFQVYFCNRLFLNTEIKVKPKKAAFILTGGGKGRPDEALRLGKFMLKQMGGKLDDTHIITSLNTDEVPASKDIPATEKLRKLAELWNSAE